MKKGKPVPLRMIEALSEYLTEILRLGGEEEFGVRVISEASEATTRTDREDDAWRMSFLALFSRKVKPFTIPEEAYCRDEADVIEAATMILHSFGHRETKSANKNVCLEHALRVMKRTPDVLARLAFDAWRANEASVLFTVREMGDGSIERIGASVVIPVTRAFYRKFRSGEAEGIDATPEDMPGDSMHILIEAVNENVGIDTRKEKAKRSMLQIETLLYQLAAACSPLSWAANPSIITIAGDEESRKRLISYGFKEVGSRTRLSEKRVMEFAPPKGRNPASISPADLAHYLAMKSILVIYQFIRSKALLLEF